MKSVKTLLTSMVLIIGLISLANGAQIPISSVTVDADGHLYNNNPSLLSDGIIPPEGTAWTDSTNVWWQGPNDIYNAWIDHPSFILDFGAVYRLDSLRVQVDNNDSYELMFSTNGTSWIILYVINAPDGNVTWGMDTFDIPGSSFAPVNPVDARYIKLFALGGDGMYAASEIQAFGTPATGVPEPTTMLLLGSGLVGLVSLRRRFRKENPQFISF